MHITRVSLPSANLAAQARFYGEVLGLPIRLSDRLQIEAGKSTLEFFKGEPKPQHFAFNVPAARFDSARAWIQARASLIVDSQGRYVFAFESWRAHAAYFHDADGNILEIIARQGRPLEEIDSGPPLVEISEIGIACQDVAATMNALGLPVYGVAMEDFAAVGDEQGLLILASLGRVWYPTAVTAATEVEGAVDFIERGERRTVTLPLA